MSEIGLKEWAAARFDAPLAPADNCGQHCGQTEEKVVSQNFATRAKPPHSARNTPARATRAARNSDRRLTTY